MTGVERCGWCETTAGGLVAVGLVEQLSGRPAPGYACPVCLKEQDLVPASEHPGGWAGGMLHREELRAELADLGELSPPGERRRAVVVLGRVQEVAGHAGALQWELDRSGIDWGAARSLAARLVQTSMLVAADISEDKPTPPPPADPGTQLQRIVSALRALPEAGRLLHALDRELRRPSPPGSDPSAPRDLARASDLAGQLADAVAHPLLVLRGHIPSEPQGAEEVRR